VRCASIDYSPERPIRVAEVSIDSAHDLGGTDVRPLLLEEDGVEYAIAPGDTAEITFRVPDVPHGHRRTYLARTSGWYRIHTPETGEPQTALVERLESEAQAAARLSVRMMNQALSEMAAAGRAFER
jgi:hypothetical protein